MIRRIFALALAGLVAFAPAADAASNFDWTQLQAMLKQAYLGSAASAASAGNVSCSQIWNPAASGKVILLWTITISETVAGIVQVGTTTTELSSPGSAAVNKYFTASAGVALTRQQQPASFAFTGGTVFWQQPLAASTLVPMPMKGPIVITAGAGVAACTATVNDQLNASFEWDEISG